MINDRDLRLLTKLSVDYASQGGWATCATNPPSAALQSLVDRGFCRLSPARSGPLGLLTGEVMVSLTEVGTIALKASTLKCATEQQAAFAA